MASIKIGSIFLILVGSGFLSIGMVRKLTCNEVVAEIVGSSTSTINEEVMCNLAIRYLDKEKKIIIYQNGNKTKVGDKATILIDDRNEFISISSYNEYILSGIIYIIVGMILLFLISFLKKIYKFDL